MELISTKGMSLVIAVILARLLAPEAFGLVALVTVFINIAEVFVQSGLGIALIQHRDADEVDFSSVFYLSLAISLILCLAIYFTAVPIAKFYMNPDIAPMLKMLAMTLLFGAVNSVQTAMATRKLKFKEMFISSAGANIVSGATGIYLAYSGFGVWSLVGQQMSNSIFLTLILWNTVGWRPKRLFSIQRIKMLISLGGRLLASSLIDVIYENLSYLIIGKMYRPGVMGFYNRGRNFPETMVGCCDGAVHSVMFPVMASYQGDTRRLKNVLKRALTSSCFVIFPMTVGLFAMAKPLVSVLLTDKWLPCVPFIRIFCAVYIFWPIHTENLQAIKALGRGDIYLKLEVTKKVLGLSVLAVSVFFGVHALALGSVLSSAMAIFINSHPNKELLDYGFAEQWQDIKPMLWLSLVTGSLMCSINIFNLSNTITLAVQGIIGASFYISASHILQMDGYKYLVSFFPRGARVSETAQ